MHDLSSIAPTCKAPAQRNGPAGPRACNAHLALRHFFRPYVLAFVALAVAVGGCSYGYKLTQYLHQSEVTRACYSRIWVDHRNHALVSTSEHHVLPDNLRGLHPLPAPAPRDARPSQELVVIQSAPTSEAFIFSALIPLRAPPVTDPSLA